MKIRANRKERNFRYLATVKTYAGLSREEVDIAVNGIPFRGQRYPLCYVFWGSWKYRNVFITLTKEIGVLIGESIIEHSFPYETSIRGIVMIEESVTDLSYSVLQFV